MKVLLFSSLSAFLLTGCDNFQLLKPLAQDSSQVFKIPTDSKNSEASGPDRGSQERGSSNPPKITNLQPPISEGNSTRPAADAQLKTEDTAPVPPTETANVSPKAPPVAPAPSPAEPVVEAPVRSPEKAVAPAPATGVAEKPTASPAVEEAKPKANSTDSVVTVVEYLNLTSVLNQTFGVKEKSAAMATVLPADSERADIKIVSSGGIDKMTHQIFNKEKLVIEAVDIKIALNGKTLIPLDGYNLHALCSGAQCNILFITVTKSDETKKIVENYPYFMKLVNGKYVQATFKKQEEYAADRNALPDANKIKLVPQLSVTQKWDEHMKAHGALLVSQIQSKLKSNEKLAYTDNLIGAAGTKTLSPLFFRQEGKMYLQAKLELPAPRKALEFKSEVKNESASQPSRTDQGLSMTVLPAVKDQIYLLVFEQENYKSKIANVEKGLQVMVCSLVEEENNFFSTCVALKADIVFSEANIVEGTIKTTIKRTVQN